MINARTPVLIFHGVKMALSCLGNCPPLLCHKLAPHANKDMVRCKFWIGAVYNKRRANNENGKIRI